MRSCLKLTGMTKPLALCFYENLMPGSQLVNRLQDLDYRVQAVGDAHQLVAQAIQEKPLVVLTDLACRSADICSVIRDLRQNPATNHIPVLAFTCEASKTLHEAARSAGATLVAAEKALNAHLPQLLAQVLEVE